MICLAHRGASGHKPENTLGAIARALELGAKWIEIDVYSVEDQLVVIHDDKLERTTSGHGYVMESTLQYLKSLDAGEGEQIPFLEEVFQLVSRKAGINIELKGPETAEPVVAFLTKQFSLGWTSEDVLISSFDISELVRAKRLAPDLRIGPLMREISMEGIELAKQLGAYSVNASMEHMQEHLVKQAHVRGLKVFAYTVNSPEDIQRMRAWGVDGVFSDFPERVLT